MANQIAGAAAAAAPAIILTFGVVCMIDFFVNCLDLIFMWFSSESWLVVLPFCVMVLSVIIMFVLRLCGGNT